MRPESNQHSLFQPPPQSLVIRLIVKQLKCSSKAKGTLIRDECTLAHVIDRLFQHIEEGSWGGLPSLFHAQLHVQLLPSISADVLEWTRAEGAWLGVGGGGSG